jgi:hypothetical protein
VVVTSSLAKRFGKCQAEGFDKRHLVYLGNRGEGLKGFKNTKRLPIKYSILSAQAMGGFKSDGVFPKANKQYVEQNI